MIRWTYAPPRALRHRDDLPSLVIHPLSYGLVQAPYNFVLLDLKFSLPILRLIYLIGFLFNLVISSIIVFKLPSFFFISLSLFLM